MIDASLNEEDLSEFLAAGTAEAMDAFWLKHRDWTARGLHDDVPGRRVAAAVTHRIADNAELLASARLVLIAALSLRALADDCTLHDLETEGVTVTEREYWEAKITFSGLAGRYVGKLHRLAKLHDSTPLGFLDVGVGTEEQQPADSITFKVWSYDDMPKPKAIADALAGRIGAAHMSGCRVVVEDDFEEHYYADSLLSELWHIAVAKSRGDSYIIRCAHCGTPVICDKKPRKQPRKYCSDKCRTKYNRAKSKAKAATGNS